MSARVEKSDDEAGVLWIIYEGRGDELAANLRSYCVDFVRSLYFSRIGIPYRSGLGSQPIAFGVFAAAACSMIDLLTACRGVTESDEREFATSLAVVQSCQKDEPDQSVQGRELADWVRSSRKVVSDNGRPYVMEASV